MSQKGISFRLNTQITTIAILTITAIVFVNYHFSNKILIQKIEEGAVNQSNFVISQISRIIIGTEEITRNVSYQTLYFNKNNDIDLLISQVLKANPVLDAVRINLINQQNHFQSFSTIKNDLGYNLLKDSLQTVKLITALKQVNQVISKDIQGTWSSPFYHDKDSSNLIVTYSIPILSPEKKEFVGVVSSDISLEKMRQMLSKIKIGVRGYAFVIDQTKNFITHPKKEWVLHRNLGVNSFKMFGELSADLEEKISQGKSGAVEGISEYLGNEKAWYYFEPLPNSGWYTVIVFPETELFQDINSIFYMIIYVSIAGIILLFLINFFVFRKMLDPLIKITYAIKSFTSAPGKGKKSNDEIKMLAESLEDWQTKYGLLINDQSKTAHEKLKIEKDLKTAQEIQQNIVPSGNPEFLDYPEIDLYAILKPAEIIGGDLYDYFFIGKNHLLIAIGDVSGKGIPASLFMAIASTLIKTNAKILSSKDIVSKVNKELCERNSNQYFVTLFLGILDVRYGILDYCNAAHNFPYILHKDGSLHALSKSHGLPLGIYNDKIYKNSTVELHYGDTLILYTDGVINSMDVNKQRYGTDKLEVNIKNLVDSNSEEVVSSLEKSIRIFEGENKQADDISLLALKYLKK